MTVHKHSTIVEYDRIFSDVKEYQYDRTQYDITLDDFCEKFGYSRRSVQRALQNHGTNWRSLLFASRMEEAERLLRHTNSSIGDIAYRCGYSNHSLFTRHFTQHFGKSPSLWRKHRVATVVPSRRRNGA